MTTLRESTAADQIFRFLGIDCRVHRYADRAAWKAARTGELRDRCGASELSALFGCEGAYDSQYSLWSKRTDPAVWAEEVERESEQMYWGKLIEGVILGRYHEQTGLACHGWPQTDIVVAGDWPGFCTPDAIVEDAEGPIVTELKGFNEHDRRRWQDGPPIEIILQNLHQQEVTGIHRGRIIALFGNQIARLGVYDVDYDESFAATIRDRAERFSQYVRCSQEPPVDESTMTAEAIQRLHPDDDGSEAELPEDGDALAIERESLKVEAKRIDSRLTAIDNRLKAAIADATYGCTPGQRWFSWKTQTSAGIDRQKLRDEYPEVAEAVATVVKFRVLRPMKSAPK